ncbi:hypothetical protein NX794_04425 [Streptomyces sp. LP11]|uniref:Uncharacterized protein n=1 Tax=Streptomyces pyxinicus TaxID=2970331 RepID=A0ABT2AWF4_9ACTN|nr:hypothetical protein [Streptomyces sp. LP11]MCS0600481.1 hypothetical protein [Streptomyces sp. LP11]
MGGTLFRNAVRALSATGLVIVGSLGAAAGASATGTDPARAGGTSGAVRLEYFTAQHRLLEAGDPLWFSVRGMRPGWDRVEVTSPALQEPITLVPAEHGSARSAQVDAPGTDHRVRSGLRAGTYPVTATSHGRTVATARLKVAAEGSADIGRFVIGPADAVPGGDTPASVRPGSDVRLVLTDLRAADREHSLTVTSPVFDHPVTIRTDSPDDPGCKCDDGGTVYAGHARLRADVPHGRYPLTVISHHGRQTTRQHVTVAGDPVAHGPSPAAIGALAAAAVALVTGGGVLALRRRRRARGSTTTG